MIQYKSIDQSQFTEAEDIEEQERRFDEFLKKTLLEIQASQESFRISQKGQTEGKLSAEDKLSAENKEISIPYIFLKTCNRSELYYGNGDVPNDVARHLFRVVSGLESAIVGERAVQGQVKEAYYSAKDQQPLTAQLHKLFQSALQVGKRVTVSYTHLTLPTILLV